MAERVTGYSCLRNDQEDVRRDVAKAIDRQTILLTVRFGIMLTAAVAVLAAIIMIS